MSELNYEEYSKCAKRVGETTRLAGENLIEALDYLSKAAESSEE